MVASQKNCLTTMSPIQSPLVSALQSAAESLGYKLVPVPREEFEKEKIQDRLNDMEAIATGKSTPDEIQERNSIVRGKIRILDDSRVFAR